MVGGVAALATSIRPAAAATESELGFALLPAGRISGTLSVPEGKPPFPLDPAAGVTQRRAYTDPTLPVDPAVVAAVAALIAQAC